MTYVPVQPTENFANLKHHMIDLYFSVADTFEYASDAVFLIAVAQARDLSDLGKAFAENAGDWPSFLFKLDEVTGGKFEEDFAWVEGFDPNAFNDRLRKYDFGADYNGPEPSEFDT